MAKLEGIIYKTFDHYVVLRGFARSRIPKQSNYFASIQSLNCIVNFLNAQHHLIIIRPICLFEFTDQITNMSILLHYAYLLVFSIKMAIHYHQILEPLQKEGMDSPFQVVIQPVAIVHELRYKCVFR